MKNQSATLYIIGNGFDLHHNIKSSYRHFKEYVKTVDTTLFELVDEYLQIEKHWSDFEEALASIDIETLTEYANDFLVSYSAENWSDAYHHDYQYEIEEVTRILSETLKQHFEDWLRVLNIPRKNEVKKQLLVLEKSAKYLTFNYTNTLTKTYKVNNANILHIHGSLKDSEKIILGHNWKPKNKGYLNEYSNPEDMDPRILEGNTIIERYFRSTFKPTKKIIKKNKNFFSKLRNIKKIIVLGHSLSQVDLLYFEKIVKKINKYDVKWIISYYSQADMKNHMEQFQNIGVLKKNIQLVKLTKMNKSLKV